MRQLWIERLARAHRRVTAAMLRVIERYLAKGSEGLADADAIAVRRLNSWTFLVVLLIPLIVVQQLLGPQRRTAVVNVSLLLVVLACRAWALRRGADRRAHVTRAHDLILVATVLDLVVTALLNGGVHAAGLWYVLLIPITAAHMRGLRKTVAWTAVCISAVLVVAPSTPSGPSRGTSGRKRSAWSSACGSCSSARWRHS